MRCVCCNDFMGLCRIGNNIFSNIEIYECYTCGKTLKIEKSSYGNFEITLNPSEYKSLA